MKMKTLMIIIAVVATCSAAALHFARNQKVKEKRENPGSIQPVRAKLLPYDEQISLKEGLDRYKAVVLKMKDTFGITLTGESSHHPESSSQNLHLMEMRIPEGSNCATPDLILEMRKVGHRPASMSEALAFKRVNTILSERPVTVMGVEFRERGTDQVTYFKISFAEPDVANCQFEKRSGGWTGTHVVPVVPLR